jgi:short-subunit dehydrogenase
VLIPDKVVVITGASGGIGAACAEAFGRRSARLSLIARRPIERPGALVTAGDITVPETRARLVETTVERFGRIDILVNNAGMGIYDPAWKALEQDTRRMFELNFFAPLALTQLVVPHMRERKSGVIVNVGSIAGKVTLPWMTLYSASKYALGSLTDGIRMELKKDGIHAMTVCPGYVRTPFQDNAIGKPPAPVVGARRFAISAAECAEAIVRGVEREARTVVTPAVGWLFIALERLLPGIVDSRLMAMLQDGE